MNKVNNKELKKLYSETILNWTRYLDTILYAVGDRECPFCTDSGGDCEFCEIDHSICDDSGILGYYQEIWCAESILHQKVREMIKKLKEKRDQL